MPGPDRDPALGRRPQVGHVEIRVEDLAERPRDRCRGHQQDVRRVAAGLCLELAALLDPEPVLLVDDHDAERRERDPFLDQRMRPDDDRRHAGCDEVERLPACRRGQRSGEELDGHRRVLEERRERRVVLPGEEVCRREEGALEPGPRGRREGVGGDRRLARPDVALEQPEHRRRAGEVRRGWRDRRRLVGRQLDRPIELSRSASR